MYLTWVTWQSGTVAGCTADAMLDCDDVLGSRWSKWFGLPVSLFGALTYVSILGLCWPAASRPAGLAMTGLFALALLAAGSAAWFVGLQAIQIQSFCFYCLTVHSCGLIAGVLTLILLLDRSGGSEHGQMRSMFGVVDADDDESASGISGAHLLAALGIATVGLAALIGGQLLSEPVDAMVMEEVEFQPLQVETPVESASEEKTEGAEQTSESSPESDDPVFEKAETIGSSLGPRSRWLVFQALPEEVDVMSMPILGNTRAEHVVVEMMDYTCKHCRHLHPHILTSLEKYGDQLAVVIHHVPLSKKCNPHVTRNHPGKKYACDYAQLAVGVWRLAPEKFPAFHDWLLESEKPPSVTTARKRALSLVGDAILLDNKVKADISKRLGQQSSTLQGLKSGLPVLLLQNSALRGVPKNDQQFFDYLETKLGVVPR